MRKPFYSAIYLLLIILVFSNGSAHAESANIELNSGWNLISLPLQPSDTSIGQVLASIAGKYISVWAMGAAPGRSIIQPTLISAT